MEKIKLDKKNNLELIKEDSKELHGVSYRISRPTTKVGNLKKVGYAKFQYFPEVQDSIKLDYFEEMIVFGVNLINEQEAKLIFNYISNCFDTSMINSLKESIKYIQSTFGKALGFTKEKVLGKIGELLFIKHCLEKKLNLSHYFQAKANSLFDFYISNNDKYLEIKTISKEGLSVKLNIKQLTYKPDQTLFGIVKLKEDDNGARLIDLVEDLLEREDLEISFKDYLFALKEKINDDIFCEDTKFDTKNIQYLYFLENKIQNKIEILNQLGDEQKWEHIESIKLTLNLTGIESSDFDTFNHQITG